MSILNLFILVFIIVLGIYILRYLFVSPYSLQGLTNGKTSTVIKYSNLATDGSDTPSSNYTFSVWFYINDWNYRYGDKKVILGRMGGASNAQPDAKTPVNSIAGIDGVNPCPLVFFGERENNLFVAVSCFAGSENTDHLQTVTQTYMLANVPIQKWCNFTMSIYGRTMDLYLDGKLVKTCLLPGVAFVNPNADLFVCPMGGFDGFTSRIQYFPNALNPQDVWNMYIKGYSDWSSIFNTYHLQFSLVQNGVQKSTLTI